MSVRPALYLFSKARLNLCEISKMEIMLRIRFETNMPVGDQILYI